MLNKEAEWAEAKWGDRLDQFLYRVYDGHWLPSHNRAHHERVWLNARRLAAQFTKGFSQHFFEALYLACHFHDTGLLFEKGPNHGEKSREICERFLALHKGSVEFNPAELLQAIQHHDDKAYTRPNASKIYQLLAMADDLDAFGAIGAYRYIEIYLLRNKNIESIPNEILANANNRFSNLLKLSKELHVSIKPYLPAYDLLVEILAEKSFQGTPASLVTWINDTIVAKKIDPFTEFEKILQDENPDARTHFFLTQFLIESDEKIV